MDTVPLIVDANRVRNDQNWTRCYYLYIEADEPSPGWTLNLDTNDLPFFMMGLQGVIYRPLDDSSSFYFDSLQAIEQTYERVEKIKQLNIYTQPIWIPRRIFKLTQTFPEPGYVFRFDISLFARLLSQQQNLTNFDDQFDFSRSMTRTRVTFSKREYAAFSEWSSFHIGLAIEQYPKNQEFALNWFEDDEEDGVSL